MLAPKDLLGIMVYISKADDMVAPEELDLMYALAEGLGLSKEQATSVIENPGEVPNLKDIPSDDKFDALYNIIKIMKADGKVHRKEVKVAEKFALRLGYKPGVIADMSAYVYQDPALNTNRDYLKKIADQNAIPDLEEDD